MSVALSDFERERAVLETMVPELEADGFRVVIRPPQETLPLFLRGFQPDMVAYKENKNVAFEFVGLSAKRHATEQELRNRVLGHPDWELRLVYAPRSNASADIPVASKQLVSEHLDRLEASVNTMGLTASLLMGWAVFEAAARALLPAGLSRPQPPARLIEVLASEGCITPDEADVLRRLSRMRNAVAHGELGVVPPAHDVEILISVARTLVGLV